MCACVYMIPNSGQRPLKGGKIWGVIASSRPQANSEVPFWQLIYLLAWLEWELGVSWIRSYQFTIIDLILCCVPSPVSVRALEYTRQSLTEKQSSVPAKQVIHTCPMTHILHSIAWYLWETEVLAATRMSLAMFIVANICQPYGQTNCDTFISFYEYTFTYSDGAWKHFSQIMFYGWVWWACL